VSTGFCDKGFVKGIFWHGVFGKLFWDGGLFGGVFWRRFLAARLAGWLLLGLTMLTAGGSARSISLRAGRSMDSAGHLQ
jgi:hypothetical protein